MDTICAPAQSGVRNAGRRSGSFSSAVCRRPNAHWTDERHQWVGQLCAVSVVGRTLLSDAARRAALVPAFGRRRAGVPDLPQKMASSLKSRPSRAVTPALSRSTGRGRQSAAQQELRPPREFSPWCAAGRNFCSHNHAMAISIAAGQWEVAFQHCRASHARTPHNPRRNRHILRH